MSMNAAALGLSQVRFGCGGCANNTVLATPSNAVQNSPVISFTAANSHAVPVANLSDHAGTGTHLNFLA